MFYLYIYWSTYSRYLYFIWVFPFYTTLYFCSTTSEANIVLFTALHLSDSFSYFTDYNSSFPSCPLKTMYLLLILNLIFSDKLKCLCCCGTENQPGSGSPLSTKQDFVIDLNLKTVTDLALDKRLSFWGHPHTCCTFFLCVCVYWHELVCVLTSLCCGAFSRCYVGVYMCVRDKQTDLLTIRMSVEK